MVDTKRLLFSLLMLEVLAFAGCTSDEAHRSGPSDGARTPVPDDVASISPTPEFVVGPAIEPRIVFKGRVAKNDRALVTRSIERAFEYFEVPHPPGDPTRRYAEIYGKASPYESEALYCGRRTTAGGIQIYLYACRDTGRVGITATIVHEVFHAMQDFTRDTYRRGPDIVVDGIYPNWFEEGSAEWASIKVLDEWGVESYDTARSYLLALADGVEADLRGLETFRGWFRRNAEQERRQYGLAFFAVEKLMEGRDWRDALDVYRRMSSHQVPRWDRAFKETFGLSMKRFYRRFDGYVESGFAR